MKKNYFISIFFIILVITLIYNILTNNKRVDSFFRFHRDISDIVIVNDKLNKFIDSPINFKNFDIIKRNIDLSNKKIELIEKEVINLSLKNRGLKEDFFLLKNTIGKKIALIEKLKSYRAILNNSFRNIIELFPNIEDKNYIEPYTKIVALNINPEFSSDDLNLLINSLSPSTKYEKFFLLHAKIISKELSKYNRIKSEIGALKLDEYINNFEFKYSTFIKNIIEEVKNTILILMIILTIVLTIFLIYSYKILKDKIELKRFRNAIENSDNFIMVTDKNKKIKYINQSMLNTMGYKKEEIIGKDPAIFRAGFVTKESYKKMNKTIYSGKKWTGEFINKTKSGNLIYEKASIIPIFGDNGKIEEFLGIKLDITKEKEILRKLKEKDHRLTQQAKLVIMNEILNSIAHQWRQPLSVISTATSGLLIHKEYETLKDEVFQELTTTILDNTKYLSNTIDNFKSFFKTGNDVTLFNLCDSFQKAYKLIEYRILNDNINYELPNEKIYIKGIENDFIQVIVNIFNNSIEALENINDTQKLVFVEIEKSEDAIIIKIKDNAHGIEEKNLVKIFQPYFTTKYNSQGTGMGLYMCYEIITKQFDGKIILNNVEYVYKDNEFKGVEVSIILPIDKDTIDGIK